MRSERWLNINIFSKNCWRAGAGGGDFFRIYQNFSVHIAFFPEMQKFFRTYRQFSGNTKFREYRNFSVQHTKILP